MSASPFFMRIREHVLQLTAVIPEGKVCTFQSMGQYLDVMPRHVAYILSQLKDHEKLIYPWYRVVSGDGRLGVPKKNPDGTLQADLLTEEGVLVNGGRITGDLERVLMRAEDLPSGLPRQKRPANAPVSKSRSSRRMPKQQ